MFYLSTLFFQQISSKSVPALSFNCLEGKWFLSGWCLKKDNKFNIKIAQGKRKTEYQLKVFDGKIRKSVITLYTYDNPKADVNFYSNSTLLVTQSERCSFSTTNISYKHSNITFDISSGKGIISIIDEKGVCDYRAKKEIDKSWKTFICSFGYGVIVIFFIYRGYLFINDVEVEDSLDAKINEDTKEIEKIVSEIVVNATQDERDLFTEENEIEVNGAKIPRKNHKSSKSE